MADASRCSVYTRSPEHHRLKSDSKQKSAVEGSALSVDQSLSYKTAGGHYPNPRAFATIDEDRLLTFYCALLREHIYYWLEHFYLSYRRCHSR